MYVCVRCVWVCAVYSWMNSKHFNFTMPAQVLGRGSLCLVVLVANIAICWITSIVKLVKHRNCFICKSDICCPDTHAHLHSCIPYWDRHPRHFIIVVVGSCWFSLEYGTPLWSFYSVQCFVGSVAALSLSPFLSDLYLSLMDTRSSARPASTMPM